MTLPHLPIILVSLLATPQASAESATRPNSSDATPSESTDSVDQRQALEDILFGATDEESDAPSKERSFPSNEEADPNQRPDEDAGKRIGDLISAKEDRVAIGGGVYWNTQWRFEEDAGFDPAVASPALMSLYLDARPNDNIRLYSRGRVFHQMSYDAETSEGERTRADLDQLWLKTHANNQIYFTAGLQPVRWGVGRIWNPTDFLNQRQKDPFALIDTRGGLPLVKVHVPFEAQGANVYAIVNWDSLQELKETYTAVRAEVLLGTSELTISGGAGRNSPLKLASDLSTPIGPLDVRLELSWTQGATYSEGWRDAASLFLPDVDSSAPLEDYFQALVGAEWAINYSDTRSFFIGLEYFYNQAGTDNPDLYPITLARGDGAPLYLGQHYLSGYLVLPGLGAERNYGAYLSTIVNLNDQTALIRADMRASMYRNLSVALSLSRFVGERGEFRFEFEVPAYSGVDGLEEGIQIRPVNWLPEISIQMSF